MVERVTVPDEPLGFRYGRVAVPPRRIGQREFRRIARCPASSPERRHARGLRTDAGLELLVHDGSSGLEAALELVHLGPGLLRQRCVFHVLRNVRDAVRGAPGMDRGAKRERRRQVLRDAATIWAATDRAELQRRRQAFRAAWAAREPDAMPTLERVNRALRQKARQAGVFHSEQGLVAALALVLAHRYLLPDADRDDLWTEVLEPGLLDG